MDTRNDGMSMTPLAIRETKSMLITPISSSSSSSSSVSSVPSLVSFSRHGSSENLTHPAYNLNTPTTLKKPIPLAPHTVSVNTVSSDTASISHPTVPPVSLPSSNAPSHASTRTSTTSNTLPPTAVTNRVRVAVRCRPPFEEEGTASVIRINRPSLSTPSSSPSSSSIPSAPTGNPTTLAKSLQIDLAADKCREFSFDCVFGPETTNTTVYDNIAGPIVDSVLHGVNGTVLAYGQTGSGKTYSLGILTKVTGETGIIPRSLSHIFGYIAHHEQQQQQQQPSSSAGITYSISLSFLQLYLDAVQDLLAPLSSNSSSSSSAAGPTNNHHSNGTHPNNLNASSSSHHHGGHDTSFASMNTSFSTNGGHKGNNPMNTSFSTGNTNNTSVNGNNGTSSNNGSTNPVLWSGGLPVREDPARGFYVEGLSEYNVTTFQQAITLLNLGLENRILGSTKMNVTSSRSHTILMVRIEAKEPIVRNTTNENNEAVTIVTGYRTRKSQLMLCDLAGSERVRRTSSRGARLEEARAINASLHALGQVITALSILSTQQQHHNQQQQHPSSSGGTTPSHPKVHVPWRESKLTRLLYGNLGGTANTYLLATVGPSARNAQESLSTLLFASRCMRVSATPVASMLQSQADYADLAARLQARLAETEAQHAVAVSSLQGRYEAALRDLQARLDASAILIANNEMNERQQPEQTQRKPSGYVGNQSTSTATAKKGKTNRSSSLSPEPRSQLLLSPITPGQDDEEEDDDEGMERNMGQLSSTDGPLSSETSVLNRTVYTWFCQLHTLSVDTLDQNRQRIEKHRQAWSKAIDKAQDEETLANGARSLMSQHDPITSVRQLAKGIDDGVTVPLPSYPSDPSVFGPHLGFPYRNASTAIQTIHDQHGHNNIPLPTSSSSSANEDGTLPASSSASSLLQEPAKPHLKEIMVSSSLFTLTTTTASPYPSYDDLVKNNVLQPYCEALVKATNENMERLHTIFMIKDTRFDELKRHLAAAEAAIRIRDEDVQNQRYVLKYLVDTTSQLREQVRLAKTLGTKHPSSSPPRDSSMITDAESGEYDFTENHLLDEAILHHDGNENNVTKGGSTKGNGGNTNSSLSKLMQRLDDHSSSSASTVQLPHNHPTTSNHAVKPPRPPTNVPTSSCTTTPPPPLPTKIPTVRTVTAGALPGTVLLPVNSSGGSTNTSSKPPLPLNTLTTSTVPVYRSTSNSISVDGDEDEDNERDRCDRYRNPADTENGNENEEEMDDENTLPDDLTSYNTKLNSYPSSAILPTHHSTTPPRTTVPVPTLIPTVTASLLSVTPPATANNPFDTPYSPSSPTVTTENNSNTSNGIDTIEYIVSHRVISNANGQPTLLYKVHWLGSTSEEDEWFPREDLLADFPEVVNRYEKLATSKSLHR